MWKEGDKREGEKERDRTCSNVSLSSYEDTRPHIFDVISPNYLSKDSVFIVTLGLRASIYEWGGTQISL